MFRFDKLIRASMFVRDVKRQYPQTVIVFEQLGFRAICDDCTIEVVAQRQGMRPFEVVDTLNSSVFVQQGYKE
jgi:hypothetical protein